MGLIEKSLKGRQLNGNMNRILDRLPSKISLQADGTVVLIISKSHMTGADYSMERAISDVV